MIEINQPGQFNRLNLHKNEIHLFWVKPDNITQPNLIAAYKQLLSEPELERLANIRFDNHKHQFLVTRALVRSALSMYAPIAPEAWRFIYNEYGRPEVEAKFNSQNLRFNLSHTNGLIVLGITLENDLGVDTECLQRKNNIIAIAERYFSESEIRQLQQTSETGQIELFYQLWTLKEAYIKAKGQGLHIPLNRFSFNIKTSTSIEISFNPNFDDTPHDWHFWMYTRQPSYQIAIALRTKPDFDFKLRHYNCIPLHSLNEESIP